VLSLVASLSIQDEDDLPQSTATVAQAIYTVSSKQAKSEGRVQGTPINFSGYIILRRNR
jgi:hypothetical protein